MVVDATPVFESQQHRRGEGPSGAPGGGEMRFARRSSSFDDLAEDLAELSHDVRLLEQHAADVGAARLLCERRLSALVSAVRAMWCTRAAGVPLSTNPFGIMHRARFPRNAVHRRNHPCLLCFYAVFTCNIGFRSMQASCTDV